jgi:hypothetical protein
LLSWIVPRLRMLRHTIHDALRGKLYAPKSLAVVVVK